MNIEPVITIRNLKMRFGSKEVLKGINLEVFRNQIIGYIGPNGAGKSTTVKIGKNHVYMSFSHQQMMTDAMKPLGLSFFQLLSDEFPLIQVGGRLFFDIAHDLASPTGQKIVLMAAGKMDPLMHNAIKSIMKRKAFSMGSSK